MILYSLRTCADGWFVTKFDEDFNVESSYLMAKQSDGEIVCGCPAGVRPTCRHRSDILPAFLATNRADTAWYYCFEEKTWHQPLGEDGLEPETDEDDLETEYEAEGPTLSSIIDEPRPNDLEVNGMAIEEDEASDTPTGVWDQGEAPAAAPDQQQTVSARASDQAVPAGLEFSRRRV